MQVLRLDPSETMDAFKKWKSAQAVVCIRMIRDQSVNLPAGVYTFTIAGEGEDAAASLQARFVVDGADKLILPVASERPAELYDVLSDPDERHDRAAAEPERVASLSALLDAWWRPPSH